MKANNNENLENKNNGKSIEKIAVVRIRGIRNIKPQIKKTLELMRLNKANHCVLLNNTPQIKGMIQIVKDYVAYGNISLQSIERLVKNVVKRERINWLISIPLMN